MSKLETLDRAISRTDAAEADLARVRAVTLWSDPLHFSRVRRRKDRLAYAQVREARLAAGAAVDLGCFGGC